ncbi:MAG TPA: hypothetical protein PKZ97_09105 [Azospirillaceae bacterium]|nr:hypothetical protein [Azospirillaceae bacterium]
MRHIRQMKLEVRSQCQYDCEMCAHGEQRKMLKKYELSLEDLQRFLDATRESGYYVDNMRIHGPGEPLLWRHFNEGVQMLKASGVVGTIFVATNGLLLRKISEEAWACIDEMRVSVYAAFDRHDELEEVYARHRDKIHISEAGEFRALPQDPTHEAPIPCACWCDGPMLLGDRLFLYCGPPVFAAAKAFGRDAMEDPELSVPVAPGYLDATDERKFGNMEYCKRCWANGNFNLPSVPQSTVGGNWK